MTNELIFIKDEEIENGTWSIKGRKLILNGVEYTIKRAEPRGYKVVKV